MFTVKVRGVEVSVHTLEEVAQLVREFGEAAPPAAPPPTPVVIGSPSLPAIAGAPVYASSRTSLIDRVSHALHEQPTMDFGWKDFKRAFGYGRSAFYEVIPALMRDGIAERRTAGRYGRRGGLGVPFDRAAPPVVAVAVEPAPAPAPVAPEVPVAPVAESPPVVLSEPIAVETPELPSPPVPVVAVVVAPTSAEVVAVVVAPPPAHARVASLADRIATALAAEPERVFSHAELCAVPGPREFLARHTMDEVVRAGRADRIDGGYRARILSPPAVAATCVPLPTAQAMPGTKHGGNGRPPDPMSAASRTAALLASQPDRSFSITEIHEQLGGCTREAIAVALSQRLKGKVRRESRGRYQHGPSAIATTADGKDDDEDAHPVRRSTAQAQPTVPTTRQPQLPPARREPRPQPSGPPLPDVTGLSRPERQQAWAIAGKAGNREAAGLAIHSVEAMIMGSARRYSFAVSKNRNHDEEAMLDMAAEAKLTLFEKISGYDPALGGWVTYAGWWIKGTCRRWLQTRARTVRLPARTHEINAKVQRLTRIFVEEHGRRPTDDEICEVAELTHKALRKLRLAMAIREVSFDAPISLGNGDDHEQTLLDRMVDTTPTAEEQLVARSESRAGEAWAAIADLPSRQKLILEMRAQDKTLKEIGETMGLSRERVRQIEERAIAFLRRKFGVTADNDEADEVAA